MRTLRRFIRLAVIVSMIVRMMMVVMMVVVMMMVMVVVMAVTVSERTPPAKCDRDQRRRCPPRFAFQPHNRLTILAAAQAAP